MKEDKLVYVIVCDVSDNGQLYYWCVKKIKDHYIHSTWFDDAVKYPTHEEAQKTCDIINKISTNFKYHVEEHMYCDNDDIQISIKEKVDNVLNKDTMKDFENKLNQEFYIDNNQPIDAIQELTNMLNKELNKNSKLDLTNFFIKNYNRKYVLKSELCGIRKISDKDINLLPTWLLNEYNESNLSFGKDFIIINTIDKLNIRCNYDDYIVYYDEPKSFCIINEEDFKSKYKQI